jgi:hypothetical protein
MVKDGCFQAMATHAVHFVVAIDTVNGNFLGSNSDYWTVNLVKMAKMLTAGSDCPGI